MRTVDDRRGFARSERCGMCGQAPDDEGAGAGDSLAVCPACADVARCELCRGPLYRVSLVDRTVEPLDHLECMLLSDAA